MFGTNARLHTRTWNFIFAWLAAHSSSYRAYATSMTQLAMPVANAVAVLQFRSCISRCARLGKIKYLVALYAIMPLACLLVCMHALVRATLAVTVTRSAEFTILRLLQPSVQPCGHHVSCLLACLPPISSCLLLLARAPTSIVRHSPVRPYVRPHVHPSMLRFMWQLLEFVVQAYNTFALSDVLAAIARPPCGIFPTVLHIWLVIVLWFGFAVGVCLCWTPFYGNCTRAAYFPSEIVSKPLLFKSILLHTRWNR